MSEFDQRYQRIEQFASMLQKRHEPATSYDPYAEAVKLIEARFRDHVEDAEDAAYGDDWARDSSYTNGAAMVLADMVLHFLDLTTYNAEMPA